MTTRGGSTVGKMLASALKDIKQAEPQGTIAWFKKELLGFTSTKSPDKGLADISSTTEVSTASKKNMSTKKLTSSRECKLLRAEEPEVPRPHCDKCGCGEALRPGLDCRCHCPQCLAGKKRCSSPRMSLRRKEGETCETFTRSLAKTRARRFSRDNDVCSRRSALFDNKGRRQLKKRGDSGSETMQEAPKPAKSLSHKEPSETEGLKPDIFVRTESGQVKMEVFSAACSRVQPLIKTSAAAAKSSKEVIPEKHCETQLEASVKNSPSTTGCKRARSEACKTAACCRYETLFSAGGSAAIPQFALWSDAGRLRELELICYCDACIGLRDGTCTSPRMAEFKKSGTAFESECRRWTKKAWKQKEI
ncbi:hypothetical protein Efla_001472 [Eimeria flavescens]